MYSVIISLVIATLFFITPFILSKKNKLLIWNTFIRYIESLILGIAGIILLIYHHWLNGINGVCWGMIFVFIAQAEKCVFQPQQIIINTNEIKYSHVLYPISIQWNIIEKIVIRSDYISIFKKNGRYLQFEIIDDLSDQQLKDINELCAKLIVDSI